MAAREVSCKGNSKEMTTVIRVPEGNCNKNSREVRPVIRVPKGNCKQNSRKLRPVISVPKGNCNENTREMRPIIRVSKGNFIENSREVRPVIRVPKGNCKENSREVRPVIKIPKGNCKMGSGKNQSSSRRELSRREQIRRPNKHTPENPRNSREHADPYYPVTGKRKPRARHSEPKYRNYETPPFRYDKYKYVSPRYRQEGSQWSNCSCNNTSNVSFNENEFITSTARRPPLLPDPPTGRKNETTVQWFCNKKNKSPHKNVTPCVPSHKLPNSNIIIDHFGESTKSGITYTPTTQTIKPNESLEGKNVISKSLDESQTKSMVHSSDVKKAPPLTSSIVKVNTSVAKDLRSHKYDDLEKSATRDLNDSYIFFDIPCGQGNNTTIPPIKSENNEELSSFFSQIPPSLPDQFVTENRETTKELEKSKTLLSEISHGPNSSLNLPTNINTKEHYISTDNSILKTGTLLDNDMLCAQKPIGNESKSINNVLNIKKEIPDTIPSSQEEVSIKPNFHKSKSFSISSFAKSDGDQRMSNSAVVIKPNQHMDYIIGCDVNKTRPLVLQSLGQNEAETSESDSENERLLKHVIPYLNKTKPINLCSDVHNESVFNDLDFNSTHTLTQMCSTDKEIPEQIHIQQGATPSKRIVKDIPEGNTIRNKLCDTFSYTKSNIELDSNLNSQKYVCPEVQIPAPQFDLFATPKLNAATPKLSAVTSCKSSVLPGNTLYHKYGSSNIDSMLCSSTAISDASAAHEKDNVNFQNSDNWESFEPEIESIAKDIHAILKDKLHQLNRTSSDSLVCCLKIMDFQNDSCMNNNKYIFHIKNEKLDTMKILSKCMSPNSKNHSVKETSCHKEYEEMSTNNGKQKRKKKKESSLPSKNINEADAFADQIPETESKSVDLAYKTKKKRKSYDDDSFTADGENLIHYELEVNTKEIKHKKKKKIKSCDALQLDTDHSESIGKEKKKRKRSIEESAVDDISTDKLNMEISDRPKKKARLSERKIEAETNEMPETSKCSLREMVRSEVKDLISHINLNPILQTNNSDTEESAECYHKKKKRRHKESKDVGNSPLKHDKKKKSKRK